MVSKVDFQKSFLFIITLILLIISYYVYTISTQLNNFRQYEDMKINLSQVKKVVPKIDCDIYYDSTQDKSPKKYLVNLNPENIVKLEALLKHARQGSFYDIEVKSYILLDDKKVELKKTPRYIKRPSIYQVNMYMLEVLKRYGIDDFQYKSLLSIKDQVYADKNKFIEDVVTYGKLKRSRWSEENIPKLGIGKKGIDFLAKVDKKENLLKEEDVESIVESLRNTYEKYLGVK